MTTFFAPACRCFSASGSLREEPGRLDRDLDAEIGPGKVGGVALGEELDLVAVDGDRVLAGLDRDVEVAEHGVVLEQVRHRLRVAEVVRRHDLEVAALLELGAQEVPADAAEAVDPHPGLGHLAAPLVVGCQSSLTAPLREKSVALRSLRTASAQVGGRTGKLRGRPSRSLTCPRPDGRRGLNPPPDEQEPAAGEYDSCIVAALDDLQRITS